MVDDIDNPLDDELLKELGLEPKAKAAQAVKRPVSQTPPPTSPVRESPSAGSDSFKKDLRNLTQDMPIQVVAVLGKKTMTLKDVSSLRQGEIIELKKLPQESIDLVANGKLLAHGDLVLVDGKLGIQIKQLVG